MSARRDYGEGSVYQRCEPRYGCPSVEVVGTDEHGREIRKRPAHKCRARWYGTVETGWTADGKRDRGTVSAKTKPEVLRRLRKLRQLHDAGEVVESTRVSVKAWAEKYLELREPELAPKAFNAAKSPITKWIIPTIGHRRLSSLTPDDIRAVDQAQYDKGNKTSAADATRRALVTMLNRAVAEGHIVPQRVFLVPKPGAAPSDRTDLSVEETVACLQVASHLPHGVRWAIALLYGPRQNEVLGLTDDCLDFENKIIRLEWQLQALPYKHGCEGSPKAPSCGKSAARCPEKAFRVPRNYEVKHLRDAWHLTRPKSKQGVRILAMIPPIEDALRRWLEVRPANPWGLVFPSAEGRPCNDKVDREEWWAIQCAAAVSHPTEPRWYHVHECRNFAATQLDETDASENVITSMLGHASILTSRKYMRAHLEPKRQATNAVGERLGSALLELAGPVPMAGSDDAVVLGVQGG